jgi:hypothetical protein
MARAYGPTIRAIRAGKAMGLSLLAVGFVAMFIMTMGTKPTAQQVRQEPSENLVAAAEPVMELAGTEPPLPLASLPATPVSFGDIEQGARRFAAVVGRSGLSGAREESERCRSELARNPTWSAADRCAAFDLAAAMVDERVSRHTKEMPDPYFVYQKENAERLYTNAGAEPFAAANRLGTIGESAGTIAWGALVEAAEERQQRAAQPRTAEPPAERPDAPVAAEGAPARNEAG